MGYLILYILIALISILAFQVALRWFQHGRLDLDDIGLSVFGGSIWPITFMAIIIIGACVSIGTGFRILSRKIYDKLKEM